MHNSATKSPGSDFATSKSSQTSKENDCENRAGHGEGARRGSPERDTKTGLCTTHKSTSESLGLGGRGCGEGNGDDLGQSHGRIGSRWIRRIACAAVLVNKIARLKFFDEHGSLGPPRKMTDTMT
jgi:hypothetical protein